MRDLLEDGLSSQRHAGRPLRRRPRHARTRRHGWRSRLGAPRPESAAAGWVGRSICAVALCWRAEACGLMLQAVRHEPDVLWRRQAMLDRRNFLKSAASVTALGVSAIPATADPFAFSGPGD